MLTTWGKQIISSMPINNGAFPYASAYGGMNNAPAVIEAKNTVGSIKYIPFFPSQNGNTIFLSSALYEGSNPSAGYAVGSNNHIESESDYTLGNQITGLSGTVSTTYNIDTVNNKYRAIVTLTITNNTGEDVTIKEVGKFCQYYTASTRGANASSSTRACIMVDRNVLENPVTIPNGESGVILIEYLYG